MKSAYAADAVPPETAERRVVSTAGGRLRGARHQGVEAYRGIPYAAPPLGGLRFRPPVAPQPWSGVRDALVSGPECPQPPDPPLPVELGRGAPQDEDCLTLNVWTPGADGRRRPVLVWLHGGGFTTGSSSRPLYDGSALARRGDLVVVGVNYRLGLLGLLTHPALADPQSGICGSWGFLDQIAALGWVRQNIREFGGDPAEVTVFGESAGGASAALLTAAPQAQGLLKRVMVQSGSPTPATLEQAMEAAETVFRALGTEPGDIEALQNVKIETLMKTLGSWRPIASRGLTAPRPVQDDVVLPLAPLPAVDAGRTAGIEVVVGSNRDELKLMMADDPRRDDLDETGLHGRLCEALPGLPREARVHLVDTYRRARAERGEETSPWELWCALETDRRIRVPSLNYLERHAHRGESGRAYLFDWESPARGGALGACHILEVPFCFGNLSVAGMEEFAGGGSDAERLSAIMQDAWISFARGEGGGTAQLGGWPRYDAARQTLLLGKRCRVAAAPREPERRVWSEIGRGQDG